MGLTGALRGQRLAEVRRASRILIGNPQRLVEQGQLAATLLRRHDPGAVLDYWAANRVVLLAVHRARELGVSDRAWDEAAEELGEFTRAFGVRQELAALQVTRVLAREGMQSLVLKGPGLAKRLYGDVALRDPSGDVDVLVSASDLPRACELIASHGWTQAPAVLIDGNLPELHFVLNGAGAVPSVELHWRMQWFDRYSHTDYLLDRAVEIDGVLRPAAEDLPHLLALFWARDGFHGLRLAADLGAAEALSPRAPAPPIEALARPLAVASAAAQAVLGPSPAAGPLAVGLRGWVARRMALNDRPESDRIAATRAALADLISAPGAEWWQRPSSMWWRDPSLMAIRHPQLPRRLIPLACAALCMRTTVEAARLAALRARQ